MQSWKVTLKTAPHTWSTIEVEGDTHFDAIAHAKRLLGNYPVSEVI
jgi:hypothetical protein